MMNDSHFKAFGVIILATLVILICVECYKQNVCKPPETIEQRGERHGRHTREYGDGWIRGFFHKGDDGKHGNSRGSGG